MRFVVGIDGGGSKTTAAVVGDDLGVIGTATTGPSNYRSVDHDTASANIAGAVHAALRIADVALEQVAAICMCLAGFDTELDLPVPQQALRILDYEGTVIMENDVVGAWAGATEAKPGVVVIAGTGATGLGMNERRELWRVDGWDYVLGDAGSGYAIGLAGIQTAMKMLDGRVAPTRLVRLLGEVFGVRDAESMRRLVDSTRVGKFEISGFAGHVAAAAAEGDTVAQGILARAGHDLGESAVGVINSLAMHGDTFPVCTVGSVFKSVPWVAEPFRETILRAAPHAQFRAPVHPPEVGAAILSLQRLEEGDTGSWTLGLGARRIRRGTPIVELGIE